MCDIKAGFRQKVTMISYEEKNNSLNFINYNLSYNK